MSVEGGPAVVEPSVGAGPVVTEARLARLFPERCRRGPSRAYPSARSGAWLAAGVGRRDTSATTRIRPAGRRD